MTPAVLALADGRVFRGQAVGAAGSTTGELVFNTAMTGYQEILTDPSYTRQIVTLTYPHIGNTGTNAQDCESRGVQAAGLVVRDVPVRSSNFREQQPLGDYLRSAGIVAIAGVDTRALTRHLREHGSQNACVLSLAPGETLTDAHIQQALALAKAAPAMAGTDLAREVSCTQPYVWTEGEWALSIQDGDCGFEAPPAPRHHVVALDFGVKHNILRMLAQRGCKVTVLPAQSSLDDILALKPDGVFLSNGPGDPEPCDYAIAATRGLLERKIPVFGICLGHQILALAAGGGTFKMKCGHHGANHPVVDLDSGRVAITSQNHGFAVQEDSLPATARVTHRSLFDGTVQGIALTDRPAFGFQGHPEASPGPQDIAPLFDRFVGLMSA
ncbi:glutamine-hydrolyzing carbamoyl-phosphate synthase small subunit [Amphibiibacter pelophylacis]|uniref:Glutamine-hydrolyzing carbamoyl-phosphate synthase small subunit n=1 Tax=Amphibiibacter pelophylacis TaxID=1799477 RepID=A0ACC6P0U5_9BURK